jgi:hypothetical protein
MYSSQHKFEYLYLVYLEDELSDGEKISGEYS